jgi:hypothetical protein
MVGGAQEDSDDRAVGAARPRRGAARGRDSTECRT